MIALTVVDLVWLGGGCGEGLGLMEVLGGKCWFSYGVGVYGGFRSFNGVGWWRICGVWIRLLGYRNLGEFWFGWMKVVFGWWIMFGVMYGIVWVKKFVILVKIWGRYEGLKVCGDGGFRERFERWEMLLLKNDGRRREKLGIWRLGIGHGRATTGTGRAKLLVFLVLARHGVAWPCQAYGTLGLQNFYSVFLNRSRTITYKVT